MIFRSAVPNPFCSRRHLRWFSKSMRYRHRRRCEKREPCRWKIPGGIAPSSSWPHDVAMVCFQFSKKKKENKPSRRNDGGALQFDGSHIARHSPLPPPPPPPRLHDHTSEQTHRKPRIYPRGHWPAAKPRTVTQLIRIDPSVTSERALPAQDDCARLCMCRSIGREREGRRGKERERERET